MLTYKIHIGIFTAFLTVLLNSLFVSNIYANTLTNEYDLPYNANQKIHLKEKKLSSAKSYKVIVLVNPLSIPTLNAFDVPGYSLMDALAENGYDVWGIDFIGEGKSSYPIEMDKMPASIGVYPLDAKQALNQLSYAINEISKKTGQNTISILGWSWGTVVGAMYAIKNPKQVEHLILYGAMHSSSLPESAERIFVKPYESTPRVFSKTLPSYQNVPWKMIESHWKMMIDGNSSIADQKAITAVGKIYCETDPKPFLKDSLRRPMGPMKDLFSIWNGTPLYDASKLTTPTLVIYGDQDFFADRKLYSKLTRVKNKQEIELKEATHWLIYEKTRTIFMENVISFLKNSKYL